MECRKTIVRDILSGTVLLIKLIVLCCSPSVQLVYYLPRLSYDNSFNAVVRYRIKGWLRPNITLGSISVKLNPDLSRYRRGH